MKNVADVFVIHVKHTEFIDHISQIIHVLCAANLLNVHA
jgi:hypothetical protein